jgi:TRAP-type uncharacterized transport system fused permease subunit
VGLAYLIFLLFLTALHGGVNGVAYGLKDHILPFMLLFYYSLVIKEIKLEKIFVMIGFCAAIVSVIYLASGRSEFIGLLLTISPGMIPRT